MDGLPSPSDNVMLMAGAAMRQPGILSVLCTEVMSVEYRSVLALGYDGLVGLAIQPTVLRDLPYAEAEGNTC